MTEQSRDVKQKSVRTPRAQGAPKQTQRPDASHAEPVGSLLQRALVAPHTVRPADGRRLQGTLGNQGLVQVARTPSPPLVQAQLIVGAADDPYEREAERVADVAMQRLGESTAPGGDPHAGEAVNTDAPRPLIHRMPAADAAQRAKDAGDRGGDGSFDAGNELESQLRSSRGDGAPLPDGLRSQLEPAYGANFENVRVHAGPDSARMSDAIQAKAFTHGSDIHFNEGAYDPSSSVGQRLLAHELTHVVQQGAASPLAQRTPLAEPAQETIAVQRLPSGRIQRTSKKLKALISLFEKKEKKKKIPVAPPAPQKKVSFGGAQVIPGAPPPTFARGTAPGGVQGSARSGGHRTGAPVNQKEDEAKEDEAKEVAPTAPPPIPATDKAVDVLMETLAPPPEIAQEVAEKEVEDEQDAPRYAKAIEVALEHGEEKEDEGGVPDSTDFEEANAAVDSAEEDEEGEKDSSAYERVKAQMDSAEEDEGGEKDSSAYERAQEEAKQEEEQGEKDSSSYERAQDEASQEEEQGEKDSSAYERAQEEVKQEEEQGEKDSSSYEARQVAMEAPGEVGDKDSTASENVQVEEDSPEYQAAQVAAQEAAAEAVPEVPFAPPPAAQFPADSKYAAALSVGAGYTNESTDSVAMLAHKVFELSTTEAFWSMNKDEREKALKGAFYWTDEDVAQLYARKAARTRYLGDDERAEYQLHPGNPITQGPDHNVFDTKNTRAQGVGDGSGFAIFVMDPTGALYAGSHKVGLFHHSSFLAGGKAASAGAIHVREGQLKLIARKSGHYLPSAQDLCLALQEFQEHGVDLGQVRVLPYTSDWTISPYSRNWIKAPDYLASGGKGDPLPYDLKEADRRANLPRSQDEAPQPVPVPPPMPAPVPAPENEQQEVNIVEEEQDSTEGEGKSDSE